MLVRSIMNVKADGIYHPPGEEWDCHEDLAGTLVETGAVEVLEVAERPAGEAGPGTNGGQTQKDLTVAEIKERLEAAGVAYPKRARRDELLELLANLSADGR